MKNYDGLIDIENSPEVQAEFLAGVDQPKPNGKGASKGLPFTLFDDIRATSKEWLVQDFIGVGETSCWYGSPGEGKSVLVEDHALHVAAGMQWLDRKVKQGAVLYIALERAQLVKRRAVAFRLKYEVKGLPFAVLSGVLDFRDQRTATNILETIAEFEKATGQKVILIVIDTVSRALCGGDENSPKDMGALVGNLGRIQEATGAHIALLHHVPHEADRMRGHGSLFGAVDTTVHIVKGVATRSGTVVKDNDGSDGQRVDFILESVEISRDPDTGQETTAPVVLRVTQATVAAEASGKQKLNDNQLRFIQLLQRAIREKPAEAKEMPKAAGTFAGTTRTALKKYLLDAGWLREENDDRARSKIGKTLDALTRKGAINFDAKVVWLQA
jgi:AAA domain